MPEYRIYLTASDGRILGPAIGGLLFTVVAPGAPYWVAAGMLAVACGLALRL